MTDAPDRIWATEDRKNFGEDRFHSTRPMQGLTEYVRRDPAVLAALPEVQALIAAAYEAAERNLRAYCVSQVFKETLTEQLCSAIGTTADATEALARIEREAEVRGRVKGLREAAEAVEAARQWVIHSGQRDVIAGISCGHDRAVKAILARADQIEKEGGA